MLCLARTSSYAGDLWERGEEIPNVHPYSRGWGGGILQGRGVDDVFVTVVGAELTIGSEIVRFVH